MSVFLARGSARSLVAALALVTSLAILLPVDAAEKVIQLPMRTDGPKSLDPVRGSTSYDNRAACQVYETLVQYKYLARPPQLGCFIQTVLLSVS